MMFTYAWRLNVATCAGIAILAVPVWSRNVRKRTRHRIQNADHTARSDSEFRRKTLVILLGKPDREVSDWRRRDRVCLLTGYAFLLGSAVARVLFPVA